jgi:amino acid transporter
MSAGPPVAPPPGAGGGEDPQPAPGGAGETGPAASANDSAAPGTGRAGGPWGRRLDLGTVGGRALRPGRDAGDRAVPVTRPRLLGFSRGASGEMAAEAEPAPTDVVGAAWWRLRRLLIGAPIASAQQADERLTKVKALAVFSSDALSSVAYATEAILLALVAGGEPALRYVLPIGVTIAVLLAIVATSYRQTVHGYPSGGGSYIVAKDNLGTVPGLVAGAALMIDYVLTVAVSISAGVSAVTSAFPAVRAYQVALCLACIVVVTILNLRGLRESGTIFAAPTYLFVFAMLLMLAAGLVKLALGTLPPIERSAEAVATLQTTTRTIGVFFLLNAFAQGCSAMTGVEAISNGVPAFRPPESKNAATALLWMALLLGAMFVGTTVLAKALDVLPSDQETVLSVIGAAVFGGRNLLYQFLQWTTFLILVLAANTSYADFPRLASILARDRFLPSQFTFRGDRLAFTTGIVVLGLLSAALVLRYGGREQELIPLYAVGVFLSFTLSQAGMVRHWYRRRGPNWRRSTAINAVGAATTAMVFSVILGSKFTHGAWLVALLVPSLVGLFLVIARQYRDAADQLRLTDDALRATSVLELRRIHHTVVIPVGEVDRASVRAVAYARSLTGQVEPPTGASENGDAESGETNHTRIVAVHVIDDVEVAARVRERWQGAQLGVPLVLLESPYRSLVGPLLRYIDALQRQQPDATSVVTVLLPEVLPVHWAGQLLHQQTALRLKGALLFRPHTAVTSVPYHLH